MASCLEPCVFCASVRVCVVCVGVCACACSVFFTGALVPLFLLLNTMIYSSPACSRKKKECDKAAEDLKSALHKMQAEAQEEIKTNVVSYLREQREQK
jgi:hypothetical protein